MSETATARAVLAKWCVGANGLDIGAGGDPIVAHAVCLDRAEDDGGRAHVGEHPTHLVGDAANLRWFRDGVLAWVYSSHCLEDFEDTAAVLREWVRVLEVGGKLVLFLPDQPAYAAHCAANGGSPNAAHKHAGFGLRWVVERLPENVVVVEAVWPFPGNPYSFAVVARRIA